MQIYANEVRRLKGPAPPWTLRPRSRPAVSARGPGPRHHRKGVSPSVSGRSWGGGDARGGRGGRGPGRLRGADPDLSPAALPAPSPTAPEARVQNRVQAPEPSPQRSGWALGGARGPREREGGGCGSAGDRRARAVVVGLGSSGGSAVPAGLGGTMLTCNVCWSSACAWTCPGVT